MGANILLDRLPESVMIGGKEYRIYSDFRTSILFETMMRSNLSTREKLRQILSIYYPEIPDDTTGAIDQALLFYNCGKRSQEDPKNKTGNVYRKNRVAYSFEQDAPYIYAAFQSEYHMNLQTMKSTDLHWWEFIALFDALDDHHKIKQIMYYRTCDTRGMSRKEIQHVNELRKRYELQDDSSCESKVNLARREQKMKEYVQKRFGEVKENGRIGP